MALAQRTTAITSSDITVVTAVSGRQTNVLSIDMLNPGSTAVVLDVKDNTTIFESFELPANGAAFKEWGEVNQIGRLITAGNDLKVATRTASGSVEVVVRFGRV